MFSNIIAQYYRKKSTTTSSHNFKIRCSTHQVAIETQTRSKGEKNNARCIIIINNYGLDLGK